MSDCTTPALLPQLVGMVARKGRHGREEAFGLVEGVFVGSGGVTYALIRRPDGVLESEYLDIFTFADVEG